MAKNKKWLRIVVIIFGCLFTTSVARANWLQMTKLTASDGESGDEFGRSVSISGDYCIMGARRDDDHGNISGSAYIFKRSGTSWTPQAKLTASDANAYAYFGYSVSINTDYAIVGAPIDDANGFKDSGSAYIFKRSALPNDPNWYQQVKLIASDGATGDQFGISVSISAEYCLIGAHEDDDNGIWSGSAYVFKRDPNTESWIEQAKLTASDAAEGDYLGNSVSISGDFVIVGASGNDDNGTSSGSAYIFTPNDIDPNNWDQQAKLIASDGEDYDFFGGAVSISGNYAIVAAIGDDDNATGSGAAYIFKHDGTNWNEQAKLLTLDGDVNDFFGRSVAISEHRAIVGADYDDDNGTSSGSAYIFTPNDIDPNNWDQQAKLIASDGSDLDRFGCSVSISGDYYLIGAFGDLSQTGSAYMFKKCPTVDLSGNCWVDFLDYAIFANYWLATGCSEPNWCTGADLDQNSEVNWLDLDIFTNQWLQDN